LPNILWIYPTVLQTGETVKISGNTGFVNIYDITGKMVYQATPQSNTITEWNTSAMRSGIYVIQTKIGIQKVQITD